MLSLCVYLRRIIIIFCQKLFVFRSSGQWWPTCLVISCVKVDTFGEKKGKKLGPLTCCSCCHIFDFLFSYSSCHPQPFCCSLEYVLWMSIVLQRICPPLPLKMFPPTELGSELYIANLDWPQRREIQVRCIFFLRRVFFLLLLKMSDN